MPIISADKAKPQYDVVIVGSGAAGGQSAFTLTLAGLKVAMLEAGRSYDPLTETPISSIYTVKAVLEVNGGTVERLGIHPGDVVRSAALGTGG